MESQASLNPFAAPPQGDVPAQEEWSRWIRWSDDDALTHRNGLTPELMEITGLAGW